MYVAGVIRDFTSSHSDFDLGTEDSDSSEQWVLSTVDDWGKPVQNPNSTVASVSNFQQWFRTIDGVNKETVFTSTMVRVGSENIFTLNTSGFLPIDGRLLGNDDSAGSSSSRSHNTFFTYEIHTYVVYIADDGSATGPVWNFGSSDDMWVFINGKLIPGWNLQGLHPYKQFTVTLKDVASEMGLVDGEIYRCDIFFAHRSNARDYPSFAMQLPKVELCNALSSGRLVFGFEFVGQSANIGVSGTNVAAIGISSAGSTTNGLELIPNSQAANSAGAVYVSDDQGDPIPFRVLQGFECEFDFRVGGDSQSPGFAFILQSDSPTAVGSSGSGLGYAGIRKSLAIEFDMEANPELNDVSYQHVSVNTAAAFLTGNSAHADNSLGVSFFDANDANSTNSGPLLTMNNGTTHHVKIIYTPPRNDAPPSNRQGWVQVWMGEIMRPVLEVPVDENDLRSIFGGDDPFVGFTAGTSASAFAPVYIERWKFRGLYTNPAMTELMSSPPAPRAGDWAQVGILARDACGVDMIFGESVSKFDAKFYWGTSTSGMLSMSETLFRSQHAVGKHNYKCFQSKQIHYLLLVGALLEASEVDWLIESNQDGTYLMKYKVMAGGLVTFNVTYESNESVYRPIKDQPQVILIADAYGELTTSQSTESVDGGDIVRFELTFQHAQNSTAPFHDLVLLQQFAGLNVGLLNSTSTAGSVQVNQTNGNAFVTIFITEMQPSDSAVTVATYVEILDTLQVGQQIDTAESSATWDSSTIN